MSDQPDKPTAEQVEFTKKIWTAMQEMFISDVAALIAARELSVEAASIERAAKLCLAQGRESQCSSFACHASDGLSIHALITPPHKAALAEYTDELAAKDRTITDLKAQLYSLQAGDEQRVRDISRLTIERDDARAQLAASREKEQKLIEHFEKRIETEVSKVAQLLRERQAERAAVLESAASEMTDELCEKAWSDSQMPQGEAFSDYLRYAIRAMIPASDRLALDRYVEEKVRPVLASFSDLAVEMEKHSNDHIRSLEETERGQAAVEGVCADRINAILKRLRSVPAEGEK